MSLESIRELFASVWVVWLMAIFAGIAVWAFWPRNRKRFDDASRIPLRDDEPGLAGGQSEGHGGEHERHADKQ